jgi:hypothetical protein
VTDEFGNVMCATRSEGNHGDIFTVNENAEAYYGGPGIYGNTIVPVSTSIATTTFVGETTLENATTAIFTSFESAYTVTSYGTVYLDREGSTIVSSAQPGVTITMDPPFIYQAERGEHGRTKDIDPCARDGNTENYGYLPQTVLDFLIGNKQYNMQYPDLKSCLPGGPSILQQTSCIEAFQSTTVQQVGTDLTSSTIIYVGKPGVQKIPDATPTPEPTPPPFVLPSPGSPPGLVGPPFTVPAIKSTPAASSPKTSPSLGAIIQSIFNGQPSGPSPTPSTPPLFSAPPDHSITIPAATTIPISLAPPGAVGTSTDINGTPVIIIPGPQTIAPQLTTGPVPQPIVIAHATTIPIEGAPLGAQGETTILHGTTYLIIPGATTIAPPPIQSPPAGGIFSTSTINGSPFLQIPGPTSIPLSLAPPGLVGSTTAVSGTTYLIVPSPTLIPAPITTAGVTVVSGTTELVITGFTTMLVESDFSVSGRTTVMSGSTFVVVSAATTVVKGSATRSPTASGVKSSSSGGLRVATSTSNAGAEATSSVGDGQRRILIAVVGLMVGSVVAGVR